MGYNERNRCIAQVNSNSVNEFTDQKPAAVTISPLLVCFAQLKLPSASSDLVRNIVCLTSNKPAWYQSFAQRLTQGEQEANQLQGDNANASSKVIKGI